MNPNDVYELLNDGWGDGLRVTKWGGRQVVVSQLEDGEELRHNNRSVGPLLKPKEIRKLRKALKRVLRDA